jgi:hypothetical protein
MPFRNGMYPLVALNGFPHRTVSSHPWAMVGNAQRQRWQIWQLWQRQISNLQILNTVPGFESHSLRHTIFP